MPRATPDDSLREAQGSLEKGGGARLPMKFVRRRGGWFIRIAGA